MRGLTKALWDYKIFPILIISWAIGVYLLWSIFFSFPIAFFGIDYTDIEKAGQFGDSFGILNSLLSLITIGLLWHTFRQEKAQIKLEKVNEESKLIEARFFEMLTAHSSIVQSITNDGKNGHAAILREYEILLEYAAYMETKDPSTTIDQYRSRLRESGKSLLSEAFKLREKGRFGSINIAQTFEAFFNEEKPRIGHFFRSFFGIVKYLNEHSFFKENPPYQHLKKEYFFILRSQMSYQEQLLIFYYFICKEPLFTAALEEYEFFNDLPESDLISKDHTVFLETNDPRMIEALQ